jgi:hypothetical protein|tara:strand:+ start:9240 stop:9500 length:261 start_codon:yes stop_codon:yes gene_type:complete
MPGHYDDKKKNSGGSSDWIKFVKEYAKKNNMKYNEALKKAGPEYRKMKGIKAGTKGAPSKTKPGEEDFTTKKGGMRKTARKAFEKK